MNPISKLKFLGPGCFNIRSICLSWQSSAGSHWSNSRNGVSGLSFMDQLILLSTVDRARDFFSPGAEYIQKRATSESVKAAVIDAIASSFRILCGGDRGDHSWKSRSRHSETGSALYNVLVIPAAEDGTSWQSTRKLSGETTLLSGCSSFLLVALALPFFSFPLKPWTQYPILGMMVALLFIALYVIYVFLLHHSYKAVKKQPRFRCSRIRKRMVKRRN